MTAVETESTTSSATAERETDKRAPAAPWPRDIARHRTTRIALVTLVIMIAAWVVFLLFEGPFASTWYTTRQHQLASEFNASRPHTGNGAAIALMQVPRLGVNLVVAEGDSPQQLRSGPGHRVGTRAIGERGNAVIVGHRSDWGGPFGEVATLKVGDVIAVQTQDPVNGPRTLAYKVIENRRTSAADLSPFRDSNDFRLTLITGSGSGYSDDRVVVTAVSGDTGNVRGQPLTNAEFSPGSRAWNAQGSLVVLGFGGAAFVVWLTRRRYHRNVILLVTTPLVLLGVYGVLMNLDLLLPATR